MVRAGTVETRREEGVGFGGFGKQLWVPGYGAAVLPNHVSESQLAKHSQLPTMSRCALAAIVLIAVAVIVVSITIHTSVLKEARRDAAREFEKKFSVRAQKQTRVCGWVGSCGAHVSLQGTFLRSHAHARPLQFRPVSRPARELHCATKSSSFLRPCETGMVYRMVGRGGDGEAAKLHKSNLATSSTCPQFPPPPAWAPRLYQPNAARVSCVQAGLRDRRVRVGWGDGWMHVVRASTKWERGLASSNRQDSSLPPPPPHTLQPSSPPPPRGSPGLAHSYIFV